MNLNDLSKVATTITSDCSSECRNVLLKLALAINQSPTQERAKVIEKISTDYSLSKEKVIELLGFFLAVIRLFLESDNKEFNAKLIELNFPSDFVEELPLVSNRNKIVETIVNARRDFDKIISLKWRIDINLGNSRVKKIPPSVILCLQLKNGQKYTINMNIRTFHKVRYNVALILKEIASLKSQNK